MRRRFVLSSFAKQDLQEIKEYYVREGGKHVAERILGEIRAGIRELADSPGLGHKRQDLTDDDVVFFAVRSYLIVYRKRGATIEVVAVLQGARDVPSILPRRLGEL